MKPVRAIALRFNGPVDNQAIANAMANVPFAFCANVSIHRFRYPNLSDENQPWFSSGDIRQGVYAGVDHAALRPLDEEIIERMRDCEATFMYMMIRQECSRNIPYMERKQRYLRHLRFWNDFLERHAINLLLSSSLPHEMPDHIVYALCKLKGIPTVFNHATLLKDTQFLQEDIEESASQIGKRYAELTAEGKADVALCPQFEQYYAEQTQPEGKTTIIFPEQPQNVLRRFFRKVLAKPAVLLHWIPSLFYLTDWIRRLQKMQNAWRHARLLGFYDRCAVDPDFTKQYVYFPLQYQPECSTCPMAGAFVDQEIAAQLLSHTVPEGVLIYVKEHPRQRKEGIVGRNIAFFRELAAMPNVRLIKHEANTFKLREHSRAVATGTGTAGMEAIFRGKPVLLFGHTYYQYAPAVFQIRTRGDCEHAMEAIFKRGEKPEPLGVRRFLKAMEDTRVHGSLTDWYAYNLSDMTVEESRQAFTKAFTEKLQKMFGNP